MLKRIFDACCAALMLVLAGPVILLLAFAIRRESEGPGIFVQERVGRNGRHFRCYKLRSMYGGLPSVPTHQALASQITPIGRALRRWKLDELPQLWNVLRGDMSLVGPRPCLPTQAELIEERLKRGVLSVRPGITGLSQINGIDMSDPARLAEKDAQYVRDRSLLLDLRILFLTFFGRTGTGVRI